MKVWERNKKQSKNQFGPGQVQYSGPGMKFQKGLSQKIV